MELNTGEVIWSVLLRETVARIVARKVTLQSSVQNSVQNHPNL